MVKRGGWAEGEGGEARLDDFVFFETGGPGSQRKGFFEDAVVGFQLADAGYKVQEAGIFKQTFPPAEFGRPAPEVEIY